MAITCLGDCGHSSATGVSGGVGTLNTFSVTLTQAIPAKSRIYLLIAAGNAPSGQVTATSDLVVSDSGLNSYAADAGSLRASGSDSISLYMLSATATAALSVGDAVSGNFGSSFLGPNVFQNYLVVVLASSPTKRVFDDTTGNTSNHGHSDALGFTPFTLGANVSSTFLRTTPKITISLVAFNTDQTFSETFTPNYTNALKFAVGSGANQGTLSISYALSNSPDGVTASTYAPTYTLDSITTPGVSGHSSIGVALNDYFLIDSQSGNPWILAPRRGGYHLAYAKDGAIVYKTSQTPGKPAFGSEISVTSGTTDSEPRMVDTGRQGRLYIVFARGSDCYLASSDGDGESGTWEVGGMPIFAGLKHPTIAYDARNGMLWLGAYEASTGKIKASVIQPIGAAPSTAAYIQSDTGADLSGFDDDTFHIAPAYEGGGRWQLIAMKSGSATVWQSVDDGLSFKQVV